MPRYSNCVSLYYDLHRGAHIFWVVVFMILFPLSAALALSVRTVVVDPNPMVSHLSDGPLEKTIDYFTSTRSPSIILIHHNGGIYLYTNDGSIDGKWSAVRIDGGSTTSCYERSRSIKFSRQTYPNLAVSCNNKVSIFNNPANDGLNPTTNTWTQTVIASQGAHDIRIADIDGDGKLDVIGSASAALGAGPNFIAYQNSPTDWQVVSGPIPPKGSQLQDAIAVLPGVQGRNNNIVGPSNSGGIYWFSYPGSRTGQWTSHFLGAGDSGSSVSAGLLKDGSGFVVAASNESYSDYIQAGLVVFNQPSNPDDGWTPTTIDPTFAAVHEINVGMFKGSPYIVAAEEVQACLGAPNYPGYHPGIGCRVTLFRLVGGSWTTTQLDPNEHGSHNQSTIMDRQNLLVAGANYGGGPIRWQALQIWVISP
jgi:hypothetical protein